MKTKKKYIGIGILIGIILNGLFTIPLILSQSGNTFIISKGMYPHGVSYTIYREGSTYYSKNAYGLSTSGTNISAIYHNALNSISSGTIFFAEGTYIFTTPLFIKSDITLEGVGSGSNIQINKANWYYIVTNENPTIPTYDKRFTIRNLKFRNLTSGNSDTDRWNATNRAVILLKNATEVTIENLIIKTKLPSVNLQQTTYTTVNNIETDGGIGLTYSSSKNRITNNRIHDVTDGHGITMSGYLDKYAHDNIIDSNTVVDTSGLGITVDDGSYRNIISNNYIEDTGGDGINGEIGVYENTYSNNILYKARLAIAGNSTYPCWNNIIEGNTIINGSADALYLNYAHRTQVLGNKIINAAWSGILINYSNDTIVSNNFIEASGNSGIRISNSFNANIQGNRIIDPLGSQEYGIREHNNSDINILIGNYAYGTTVGIKMAKAGASSKSRIVGCYNGTSWISTWGTG